MPVIKNRYLLIFTIFLWACSNTGSDSPKNSKKVKAANDPIYDIKLELIRSYGSTEEEYVMVGGALVDVEGRVYITDHDQKDIKIFDAEGNHLKNMGGKGKGPGEFISMSSVKKNSNYLYVNDTELKRISAFSLDSLALSHTIALDSQHIDKLENSFPTSDFHTTKEGRILLGFSPMVPAYKDKKANEETNFYQYYWLKPNGKIASKEVLRLPKQKWIVGSFRGRPVSFQLDFHPQSLMTVAKDGTIYSAWSEEFLIEVRDTTGQIINTIKYPFERAPVNREKLIDQYDIYEWGETAQLKKVREMDLPDTWPALHSMQVDDKGRLWVSTIKAFKEEYQIWVLNKEGDLLARFNWPWEEPIQDIRNSNIYVTDRDEQGEAQIVQYKFNLSEES